LYCTKLERLLLSVTSTLVNYLRAKLPFREATKWEVKLIAFPANIRVWKSLTVASALAYCKMELITSVIVLQHKPLLSATSLRIMTFSITINKMLHSA
jgi:hypothetical protein